MGLFSRKKRSEPSAASMSDAVADYHDQIADNLMMFQNTYGVREDTDNPIHQVARFFSEEGRSFRIDALAGMQNDPNSPQTFYVNIVSNSYEFMIGLMVFVISGPEAMRRLPHPPPDPQAAVSTTMITERRASYVEALGRPFNAEEPLSVAGMLLFDVYMRAIDELNQARSGQLGATCHDDNAEPITINNPELMSVYLEARARVFGSGLGKIRDAMNASR